MEEISIRKAKIEDIPAMTGLLYQLFSIEEDFTFNQRKQEQGLTLLINEKNYAIVLVAELNNLVIGMLTAQINISTVEGNIALTLEDMVVDENLRGKGIGKMLMNKMQKLAENKGITRMQLLADKTNSPALAYYSKLGWKPTQLVCLRKYTSINS